MHCLVRLVSWSRVLILPRNIQNINQYRILGRGSGVASPPPPPSILSKKKSQKEEKPEGQATKISSRSGSATAYLSAEYRIDINDSYIAVHNLDCSFIFFLQNTVEPLS